MESELNRIETGGEERRGDDVVWCGLVWCGLVWLVAVASFSYLWRLVLRGCFGGEGKGKGKGRGGGAGERGGGEMRRWGGEEVRR